MTKCAVSPHCAHDMRNRTEVGAALWPMRSRNARGSSSRYRRWGVWGIVCGGLLIGCMLWSDASQARAATNAHTAAAADADELAAAVRWLRARMEDHVCLSCADARVPMHCIVWPDGRVWRNTTVLAESAVSIAAFETAFTVGVAAPAVLQRRPQWIDVQHDTAVRIRVTGREAHCVAHALQSMSELSVR
jgi:hypothetical protein